MERKKRQYKVKSHLILIVKLTCLKGKFVSWKLYYQNFYQKTNLSNLSYHLKGVRT